MSEFAVSVIIPVYNAAPFLQCAVDSALRQPEVKEVVLVDDGSTDGSYAVAERLQESHPDRIKLFAHPDHVNRGPGAARNRSSRSWMPTTGISPDISTSTRRRSGKIRVWDSSGIPWATGGIQTIHTSNGL
jgi:cellulose synthase/poly-beta-1,6-N-acetylglucosamine synthase-like glycosyltransferase